MTTAFIEDGRVLELIPELSHEFTDPSSRGGKTWGWWWATWDDGGCTNPRTCLGHKAQRADIIFAGAAVEDLEAVP